MKYIRTKDGRIGTGWEIASKPNVISFGQPHRFRQEISIENILKQADTIEELCDEVCECFEIIDQEKFNNYMVDKPEYIKKHFEKPTVQKYEILKDYPRNELIKMFFEKDNELGIKTTIYGAIWTDKGLVYVAKMNEEGKLCLL